MDWQMLFTAIGASSSFLILVQLFFSHRYKKREHEEQRRQKTVEVMLEWNSSLERGTSFAEKIVEQFTEDQCRNLYLQNPFYVSKKLKDELCHICACNSESDCAKCPYDEKKGEYLLSGRQLLELRWYIISYLNTLETVLVAWKQATVDRQVIEHEFSYLYNPEKGWDVLSHFRAAAGGAKSYPVICDFIATLRKNEERQNTIKTKRGL